MIAAVDNRLNHRYNGIDDSQGLVLLQYVIVILQFYYRWRLLIDYKKIRCYNPSIQDANPVEVRSFH